MTFDRSKVVDALCDNLKQWGGWRGYTSDTLVGVKGYVEDGNECQMTVLESVFDAENVGWPFKDGSGNWQFFYPIYPPNKKGLEPFNGCVELVDWFRNCVGIAASKIAEPLIWVKQKGENISHLITDFYYDRNMVCVGKVLYTMGELLEQFTLLDGTPIGKEEL